MPTQLLSSLNRNALRVSELREYFRPLNLSNNNLVPLNEVTHFSKYGYSPRSLELR